MKQETIMENEKELEACPNCFVKGFAHFRETAPSTWNIQCERCDYVMPYYMSTKSEVLDIWNRIDRPTPEPPSDPAPQGGESTKYTIALNEHREVEGYKVPEFYESPCYEVDLPDGATVAVDDDVVKVWAGRLERKNILPAPVSGDLKARAENFFHANSDYGGLDPRMFRMMVDFHESERMMDGKMDKPTKVLLLASYCGDGDKNDPPCSEWRPCPDCLQQCNVAFADVLQVVGGLDYLGWDKPYDPNFSQTSAGGEVGTRNGHQAPCYYCGKECNRLAGNPGLWPIALCGFAEPGVTTWHHTECVMEKLAETQSLRQERERLAGELKEAREVIEHYADEKIYKLETFDDDGGGCYHENPWLNDKATDYLAKFPAKDG